MNPGLWALFIAVPVALVIGAAWRARQGKVRRKTSEVTVANFPSGLRERIPEGDDVTLLQLSTTFCAPCRHTRVLLSHYAEQNDGVQHVEVDLTDHPEWSTPLGVHTTPTTLAIGPNGQELFRVTGVPKPQALTEALRAHQ